MRKIGELKGKPIVEGNPNEVKNNQIHAKTEGGGITLSERKNGNLETISGGSSNNSNFEYWYIKYVPNSGAEQTGIAIQTYFRRGVARYDAFQGAVKLMKCIVWPPLTEHVYGMYAMEVLPISTTLELDGTTITLDATNYGNWILSFIKSVVGVIPDDVPEEEVQAFINQMKEQYVEISKEEFEEIYNSAED